MEDEPDLPIGENEHPLEHVYCFWYNRKLQGEPARAQETYEKSIKKIGTFNSVGGKTRFK